MIVRSRTVWYLHGFDPAATARYRRIFAAASARLGVTVEDLPDGAEGWRARRGPTVTDIRLVRYEDLVRDWRAPALWRRLLRGGHAIAGYWRDGAMLRLGRLAPRVPALAAAPFLTLALAVAPAPLAFRLGPGWGAAAVAAAAAGALWLMRRVYLDVIADLFAWMRLLARGDGQAAAFHARMREAASGIADGCEADEVLVVGHSLGGIGAILSVAALLEEAKTAARQSASEGRAVRAEPVRAVAGGSPPEERTGRGGLDRGRLALLTLGSTHGVVLAQRGEGRERLASAIARVAAGRVFWVDVSSPRDAFCVPLTDPLLLVGKAARRGMTSPRVISARLRDAPRIPGDRRTVFGAMRRHMGYLLAPEPGGGFDYADAVTGPLSLAQRFGTRGNSPSARMWQP